MLPIDPLLSVRPRGVRVTIRATTLIVLFLSAGGAVARTDTVSSDLGTWFVATLVVLVALALAVGLQAVGELVACRRLDARVRQIHVLCFGPVVSAAGDGSPRRDALIGAAGLMPLLLLAAGVAGGVTLSGERITGPTGIPLAAMAIGAVATLQVLPGSGLGGGRLLRALVWYLTDNALAGARVAAIYGYALAAGVMALGFGLVGLNGARPYWGLWAIVAGWQLSASARLDVSRTRWHGVARSRTLADVILPTTRISHAATVDAALEPLLAAGPHAPLLVVDDASRPIGIVRVEDLRGVRRADWDRRTVASLHTPITALPHAAADTPVIQALDRFDDLSVPILVVTTEDKPGRVLAVVTRPGILARLRERRPDER